MDAIDLRIVRALKKDARMAHQELSEQVGLLPTLCARRIDKLEQDGVVSCHTARIDEA